MSLSNVTDRPHPGPLPQEREPPASSLPGPVRGATETNSLAKWALRRRGLDWRPVDELYRELIGQGLISDNCQWIFDVAERDCGPAIVALRYPWLIELMV